MLGGGALLALAVPVIAQSGGPESLLPPGFGQPEEAPAPAPGAPTSPPANLLPRAALPPQPDNAIANMAEGEGEVPEDPAEYDMPPGAARSLARVGPLTAETGGVGPDAFGRLRGRAIMGLLEASHAPFVSRWGSIVLRRVLLSGIRTPGDVNGADLAAARAALLVNMGEADAARLIIQSVDVRNATPAYEDAALGAYLAAADPAGLCRFDMTARQSTTDEARWQLVGAICAAFAADQGSASATLSVARRRGKLQAIDYRLAERVLGAGPSSRRQVRIEWDNVDRLDSWRLGLATATNVAIPDALLATAGDAMRAWQARAPVLSLARRLPGVATASRLGVLSSGALTGYYSLLGDPDRNEGVPATLYDSFRTAYVGGTVRQRIEAMRAFWSAAPADGAQPGPDGVNYAALPALARAAAALPPTAEAGADAPWIIAAMLTGGYDRNAAAWTAAVAAMGDAGKARATALLAVGLPDGAPAARGAADAFIAADASEDKVASRLLVAALYGLGRLSSDDAKALSGQLGMGLGIGSRWARALDDAAGRGEKGSVALLAAVGMQTRQWAKMPPAHLAAILAAYRRVGLEPEARMIAAEAISRI